MSFSWQEIIEAPLHTLPLLARDPALPEDLRAYAGILASYMQGDHEKLAEICSTLAPGPLLTLATLRLNYRRREIRADFLNGLAELEGPLEAERQFVLALAWESLGEEGRALGHFQKACALYRDFACPRKELRAMYNLIAAESRLHPHKNFVADCQAIIEASRRLGDASFEGMALTMLSREFQVAQAFTQALTMIERSLECLGPERGTIHYYHALLHKAHVLLDLKQDEAALEILKEAELAQFPQIQAARTLLLCALQPDRLWNRALEADLLPTWKNRVPQLSARQNQALTPVVSASELEKRLLRLVYNGPVEKWDLITRLYPEKTSSLTLENRFKNLIARVRKKYPIQCVDGRYSIEKMPFV